MLDFYPFDCRACACIYEIMIFVLDMSKPTYRQSFWISRNYNQMLPECPLRLPREIGACAWLEQVGELTLAQPSTRATTQHTPNKINPRHPVFATIDNLKAQPWAARASKASSPRFCRCVLVALLHLRYHFSAYFAHIITV